MRSMMMIMMVRAIELLLPGYSWRCFVVLAGCNMSKIMQMQQIMENKKDLFNKTKKLLQLPPTSLQILSQWKRR